MAEVDYLYAFNKRYNENYTFEEFPYQVCEIKDLNDATIGKEILNIIGLAFIFGKIGEELGIDIDRFLGTYFDYEKLGYNADLNWNVSVAQSDKTWTCYMYYDLSDLNIKNVVK